MPFMTEEEFIGLHGVEAYEILARKPHDRAKSYECARALNKIHEDVILPVLGLLGFAKTGGIIKAKEAIAKTKRRPTAKRQIKLAAPPADELLQQSPMNDTEDVCDLPLTRQALASAMVRFLNHSGNILTNEAIDGGQPLISEVAVNRNVEITINGKKYARVCYIGLHWNSDLLVVGFLNNDGLLARKAIPIDGIFQFEVAEKPALQNNSNTVLEDSGFKSDLDNEDFLSLQELRRLLN